MEVATSYQLLALRRFSTVCMKRALRSWLNLHLPPSPHPLLYHHPYHQLYSIISSCHYFLAGFCHQMKWSYNLGPGFLLWDPGIFTTPALSPPMSSGTLFPLLYGLLSDLGHLLPSPTNSHPHPLRGGSCPVCPSPKVCSQIWNYPVLCLFCIFPRGIPFVLCITHHHLFQPFSSDSSHSSNLPA